MAKSTSEINSECTFCHGTGIAKYFDLTKLLYLPDGTRPLSELLDKYGEYSECPEGCRVLN